MITRRAAIALAVAAPLVPVQALGAIDCSRPNLSGLQTCSVGVPSFQLATVRQRQTKWCWAACITSIFLVHGHVVSQHRIVEKIFGGDVNEGAVNPQIVRAIDGEWTGDRGERFVAKGIVLWNRDRYFERPDAIDKAAHELAQGNPLIFASEGHATVLSKMTYLRGPRGRIIGLDSLTVRDPWPLTQNRRLLRRDEALRSDFLCEVDVRPDRRNLG